MQHDLTGKVEHHNKNHPRIPTCRLQSRLTVTPWRARKEFLAWRDDWEGVRSDYAYFFYIYYTGICGKR
jgi:hypothetical protein